MKRTPSRKQRLSYLKTLTKKSQPIKEIEHLEDKIAQLSTHTRQQVSSAKDWLFSFRFWTAGILMIYVGYIAFNILELLYIIIAGIIISIALESVILLTQRTFGVSRTRSIIIAYTASIIFLLSGLLFIVPLIIGYISIILQKTILIAQDTITIINQEGVVAYLLSRGINQERSNLIHQYIINQELVHSFQLYLQQHAGSIANMSSNYITIFGYHTLDMVGAIMTTISNVSIMLTISLLCSIEKDQLIIALSRIGGSKKKLVEYTIHRLYIKLGYWLKGQLLLCVYIGLLSYIGLLFLRLLGFGIPDTGSLALIAGLTEFVPYIGPILGSIPAILIMGIEHGIPGIIAVITLYTIIQWTENNILIPRIMNQTLGVSSLLIFLSMLIGGSVLGIMGIILAVPFAAIITISLEQRHISSDHTPTRNNTDNITEEPFR